MLSNIQFMYFMTMYTIKCARSTPALCVSERRDTRVEPQTLAKDIFDVLCADRLEVRIVSTFSDDDDRFAFADFTVLGDDERCDAREDVGHSLRVEFPHTARLPRGLPEVAAQG